MLKNGKDKIQEICTILKEETLVPAKEEAAKLIKHAKLEAKQIVNEAKEQAEQIVAKAHEKLDEEKKVFQTSLTRASKLSLEHLKQKIENNLFNDAIHSLLNKEIQNPQVVANLLDRIILAIEKEGLGSDFSAFIPQKMQVEAVNALLQTSLNKLKENGVVIGDFEGGAKLQLHEKQITIDISENALKKLMANFMRKNFRDFLFKT